jgi:hypothetical protein
MSDPEHHIGDTNLWRTEINKRLSDTEIAIGDLKAGIATVQTSLGDVTNSIRTLAVDIRQTRKDFPFATVISFAMLVLVVAGGYATLMMTPIRDQQHSNTATIAILNEQSFTNAGKHGFLDGVLEERERRTADVNDALNRRIAALEHDAIVARKDNLENARINGVVEAALQTLRDIDMHGSRKWVPEKL